MPRTVRGVTKKNPLRVLYAIILYATNYTTWHKQHETVCHKLQTTPHDMPQTILDVTKRNAQNTFK